MSIILAAILPGKDEFYIGKSMTHSEQPSYNPNETPAGDDENQDPLAPTPELQAQEQAAPAETHAGQDPQLAALQAELDATKDKLLRALAEAENTRRRAAKEREDAGSYSIAAFSRDLLSVADNLRRAIEATPSEALADERIKNLFEGIEATERELLSAFEKNHVKKLDPLGEKFDPNFHEVMFESPGTGKPAGTIFQVMEVGYTLKDRLLRPARVGVAKGESGEAPPEDNGPATPGGNINTEA